ncbi:hypothetical protein GCM10007984_14680 [Shewanella putrefaciens]|uniref:hypothetical protein n=1 Tax=Shewanella putrefaciens TaxID=24 RepID=UPI000AAAFE5B|nr:hypothetical protein [Shewanella putrefaciens]GGN16965.1 hypothetical protein GCM10007984_14680 [Shewanella putrefaciens]
MSTIIQNTLAPKVQNQLIHHLPALEQAELLSQAKLVQLNFADLLCQPGGVISIRLFSVNGIYFIDR